MRLLLLLPLVAATACETPPLCEVKTPTVTAAGWELVPNDEDELWPAPEGVPVCGPDEVQVQTFGVDEAVEIDTRFGCGWATVRQPLAVDLKAGDDVQIRVFYFSQATFPSAQAEVAVALDGEIVAQKLVDIPTSSDLFAPRITIDRDIPAGSEALFHIGNHGDNSWNLIELAVITKDVCPEGEEAKAVN